MYMQIKTEAPSTKAKHDLDENNTFVEYAIHTPDKKDTMAPKNTNNRIVFISLSCTLSILLLIISHLFIKSNIYPKTAPTPVATSATVPTAAIAPAKPSKAISAVVGNAAAAAPTAVAVPKTVDAAPPAVTVAPAIA